MALADYRLCDACEEKVFYDVELDYRFSTRQDPIEPDERAKVCGLGGSYRLQHLGDWAVLCEQCAKTHRTAILPIIGEQSISADEETVRAAIEAAQLVPNKDTDAYEALARLVTVAYGRTASSVLVGDGTGQPLPPASNELRTADPQLPPLPAPKARRHLTECAVFDPSPAPCDCGSPPKVYDRLEMESFARRSVEADRVTRGVRVGSPRRPTDAEVAEWAERHDLRGSATDQRCAFEDAQTLHMADGVSASCTGQFCDCGAGCIKDAAGARGVDGAHTFPGKTPIGEKDKPPCS